MSFFTLLIFLLILSIIVIIHELGHFVWARYFGVQVKEFGIGFPPKIITLGHWWQTKFVLNSIPFGGYVNLVGESETDETKKVNNHEGQFFAQKPWRRFVIIFAGPGVNFIFATLIFMIVYSHLGIPQKIEQAVFIDGVEKNSPAEQAQLVPGTKIIALINQQDERIEAFNQDQVALYISQHQGQELRILTTGLCRANQCEDRTYVYQVYVRTSAEKPKGSGAMGVALSEQQLFFYPWYQHIPLSIYHGVKQSFWLAQDMISGLGKGLLSIIKQEESDLVMMGPVGIVAQLQAQKTFQEGFLTILQFMGLLSLNLGIINLLPIPALDGGRLILIILENFIGRQKIAKVESGLNYFGFLFIIALSVLVTGQDIWRLFKGG